MTRQLTSPVRHKLLRSPHAKRPQRGRLRSGRLSGHCCVLLTVAYIVSIFMPPAFRLHQALFAEWLAPHEERKPSRQSHFLAEFSMRQSGKLLRSKRSSREEKRGT